MMKNVFILLTILLLVACNNNGNQSQSTESDSTDLFKGNVESNEVETPKSSEITLDFSSYHLYTSEDDKYDSYGYQPVSAKVTIDEENKKASLKLYDSGENKWYPFNFRIDEKLHLQEGIVTYTVYNNANQKGYIYVSTNRPGGLFIDINNFVFNGDAICCWMQEGGSNGSQYRENVTVQSTPNTYSSPNISSGTLHSDERIYGDFYNYEETNDCVEGVVVYEGDDDYYIVETRKGYTILERRSGSLSEGHKVRGELNRYGNKYLINRNRDSEVKVYIEDYALSDDDALEWMGKNDHLKSDDQRAYDADND